MSNAENQIKHKVNVVFFASLKEVIGQANYSIELVLPLSIAQLKQQLVSELDKGDALLDKGIQSSVDFEFTRDDDLVPVNVTEVAFFPPVTGG
ncbi:molybdopterin synthase small subunit [Marinomonas ushuaiensis DSM 15871]|uniref:Molybdopterin synthase small subunit n=1 Tax=Marinomonas ushuaiensis DSM 15871 TaxID=1122207 RepID=X7E706_9GAMM|nr:MoaD/ThiS family protein [Marinomonas ushuaiensis]ETX11742.1 molybdopterin synthase small subunit [Marinomonas ushuaiensis DSM 15871]